MEYINLLAANFLGKTKIFNLKERLGFGPLW